jgi:hypothetical protein
MDKEMRLQLLSTPGLRMHSYYSTYRGLMYSGDTKTVWRYNATSRYARFSNMRFVRQKQAARGVLQGRQIFRRCRQVPSGLQRMLSCNAYEKW